MKKLILLISFVIFSIFSIQAQTRIGVKAGGLFSTLTTTDPVTVLPGVDPNGFYETKLGHQFGVFMQLELIEKLVLQPELLWLNKGAKVNFGGKIHFNTLAIPLLIGYQPIKNFSILMGPEFSAILSARYKEGDINVEAKDGLNRKTDIGINVGFDYQLKMGLGIGLRYNHGLRNVVKATTVDNTGTTFENLKFKNRSLQFYLSYAFMKK